MNSSYTTLKSGKNKTPNPWKNTLSHSITTPQQPSVSEQSTTTQHWGSTRQLSIMNSSTKRVFISSRPESSTETFSRAMLQPFMYPMMKSTSLLQEARPIPRLMYGRWRARSFICLTLIRFNTMISGSVWKLWWSGDGPVKLRYLLSKLIRPVPLKVLKKLNPYRFLINRCVRASTIWPCMDLQFQRSSRSPCGTFTLQTLQNQS